jgi:putative ABC transport system permease protein
MIWKGRFGGLPPSNRELERDIDEELAQHLEMRAKDFEREGLDRKSAEKKAQRRFGDVEAYRGEMKRVKSEHVQRVERMMYLDELRQDIGFGFRQFVKEPALPLMIMILLAVGLGATTAIFSVVKAVLLEPLPYESPDQLVMIWADKKGQSIPVSYPNFKDWRDQNQSFEDIGVFDYTTFNLSGTGLPERLAGTMVSAGIFEILGVQPELGRTLLAEEDMPGAPRVVIVSHRLWQRRFSGDPNLIGESITLDGEPFTVIGVMPPGFVIPSPWLRGEKMDLWMSHHIPQVNKSQLSNRGSHLFLALGRMKERITFGQAQEEMSVIAGRLEKQYPDTNRETGVRVSPLLEEVVGRADAQLMMLLGAAALVLLVVCGNVAGLLMAKAATRQSEIAVRSALGAGRSRLRRQLLVENLPLSFLGAALGFALAVWGTHLLRSLLPLGIFRIETVTFDAGVFLFTLGLSLVTSLVFSLAPAWTVAKTEPTEWLKQGRGNSFRTLRQSRLRNGLVVAQFAVTLLLTNVAALMLRSYFELHDRDYGFDTENVLILGLSVKGAEYDRQESLLAFYNEVIERVEALPGVRTVAATNKLPLRGGRHARIRDAEGHDFSQTKRPSVETSIVTGDYFKTMGIPLFEGRTFTEQDRATASWSAVINKSLADRLWPKERSVGKRFTFPFDTPVDCEVVGVVADVNQHGPEKDPIAEVFLSFTPLPVEVERYLEYVKYLVVQTDVDPLALSGSIRREVAKVDPNQPLSEVQTTAGLLGSALERRRFNTLLVGVFATTALIILVTGIYGVMSFFVAQKNHEIGVRVAMGASWSGVQKLVLGQGLKLAAVGVALGLLGVFVTTKLTESMVYGVSPTDPTTLFCGIVFLLGVGLLGSWLPALRASRVDPILALREE